MVTQPDIPMARNTVPALPRRSVEMRAATKPAIPATKRPGVYCFVSPRDPR